MAKTLYEMIPAASVIVADMVTTSNGQMMGFAVRAYHVDGTTVFNSGAADFTLLQKNVDERLLAMFNDVGYYSQSCAWRLLPQKMVAMVMESCQALAARGHAGDVVLTGKHTTLTLLAALLPEDCPLTRVSLEAVLEAHGYVPRELTLGTFAAIKGQKLNPLNPKQVVNLYVQMLAAMRERGYELEGYAFDTAEVEKIAQILDNGGKSGDLTLDQVKLVRRMARNAA